MITYPLNNIDYTAEDAELYFSTRESGVYDGNDFEVTVSGIDNDVTVGIGTAWIHNTKFSGKVTALTEPKTLTLSLPNSVYDRIDAIVIQFDANKNATEIVVKEGIASSAPIEPTVVRTESLYELHIFHVQRNAGATVIGVDNLIDLRNNSDYCGIMFDPISSIDTTLTKSGYAADAKATGEAIKRATNVLNLLDNSDFRNPVNQREQTSYSGSMYNIDRWKSFQNDNVVTVDNGCIRQTGTQLLQILDNNVIDKAKTYTLAACKVDGTIRIISGTFANKFNNAYLSCYIDTNIGHPCCVLAESDSYKWAALYEGEYTAETLPPYVPKGYAVELDECLRYFEIGNPAVVLSKNWNGTLASTSSVFFNTEKRIVPTVTYENVQIAGWWGIEEVGDITPLEISKKSFMATYNGAKFADCDGKLLYFRYYASADL